MEGQRPRVWVKKKELALKEGGQARHGFSQHSFACLTLMYPAPRRVKETWVLLCREFG